MTHTPKMNRRAKIKSAKEKLKTLHVKKSPTENTPWEVYIGGNFLRIGESGYITQARKTHYLGSLSGGLCEMDIEHGALPESMLPVANLMAAAPELLAALEACITSEGATCFSDMRGHPENMQRRLYEISDIARAAIVKARGQS